MPAVAAVPLLTPNEAGFTVKAPKLETSVPLKDSYHCLLSYLSPFVLSLLIYMLFLYNFLCFLYVSLFVRITAQYCIHI